MKKEKAISLFIVDDDKLFAAILKNMILKNFTEDQIAITVFETGERCELSLKQKPDLAIVDYYMNSVRKQNMDGIETIRMIKKQSPSTQIIMFTGENDPTVAKKALQAGAYDYVVKNDYMFQRLDVSMRQALGVLYARRRLQRRSRRGMMAVAVACLLLGIITVLQALGPGIF